MKKLNEDINRIKQLMLVESDEQLSFDFNSDETTEPQTSTPLSLESNKFTSSYRDKVFDILKIYTVLLIGQRRVIEDQMVEVVL